MTVSYIVKKFSSYRRSTTAKRRLRRRKSTKFAVSVRKQPKNKPNAQQLTIY